MNRAVSLFLAAGLSVSMLTVAQTGRGTTSGARPSACALLTKDLVTQVSPYDKKTLSVVLSVPASEDAIGTLGSGCSYGGVTMQIDPMTAEAFERVRDKAWMPMAGVGDKAYFRDNKGRFAELFIQAGTHVMTIQMDVPDGKTSASIQSNTIALAKALLPKLK